MSAHWPPHRSMRCCICGRGWAITRAPAISSAPPSASSPSTAGNFPPRARRWRSCRASAAPRPRPSWRCRSGQREAILDGNVRRVLSRVFGIDGAPAAPATLRTLWACAEAATPADAGRHLHPGHHGFRRDALYATRAAVHALSTAVRLRRLRHRARAGTAGPTPASRAAHARGDHAAGDARRWRCAAAEEAASGHLGRAVGAAGLRESGGGRAVLRLATAACAARSGRAAGAQARLHALRSGDHPDQGPM